MRFDRLRIPAFGPFTNLDIGFPAEGGDLHVIYGSNEAGKSSLLRAFRDLLFGIHGQSPDNFIHDYRKLRITGEIVSRAGERLTFQRRKGNKNTLLDANGNELPDNTLSPFLGSVDQEYFSTMFGLGTRELREGAEQLLHGKGDIGNALFSASMGGTPVQLVLSALLEESDRLFKGRATANVSIRPAVNRYKELLRKSRDAAVSPETWDEIERDLATAGKTEAALRSEISTLDRDLEWISRCEDALPTVGRLNEEVRKLELLPLMPDVSRDFVERARAARKTVNEANTEVNRLTSQIARFEELLAGCQTSPPLIAMAEEIDRLHQNLGAYQDRRNSLVDLETELTELAAALRVGMKNLELTGDFPSLETLWLSSAVRRAFEEAAGDLQKTLEEGERNARKTEDLKSQIKALETQLEALPETDLTDLRDALSVAAGATEASRTLSTSESEVRRLTNEARDQHRELNNAPNDLDATGTLPVPSRAIIRRFGEEMREIDRGIAGEESKILEGKSRIDSLQAELTRMERRGELPSEEALRKAREHRDRGWSLVLAEWKGEGGTEEFVPGTPLEEAFPQTIVRADNIVDRLREQAEAVAQAEERRFQIAQIEKQNMEAKGRILEFQNRLRECRTSWEATWLPCGITPGAPDEMEEWRENWSKLKDLLRQLRAAEETFQQKGRQVQEAKIQLAAVLSESAEKEFALLFDEAKRNVQQGEQSSGRRIEVINQLQGLKSQLEPYDLNATLLSGAVDSAMKKWEAQCQAIGMPKGISPKSGLVLLQERRELLAKFDSWQATAAKLQIAKDEVHRYELAVGERAAVFGVVGETTEARETALWKALAKAREAETQYEQLIGQIDEAKEILGESRTYHDGAILALDELSRAAKLEGPEALDEPLLANLELRDDAQNRITALRDTLSGLARGQLVDDFLARVRAEDVDALPQRKGALQSLKQEREATLQDVRDTFSDLKAKRQALEAVGDTAADYRQQAESYAAQLKEDASYFVRLRLAAHFLQTQIERFRRENQGPLLEKSGQIFSQITRGAFTGLGAEFNADDAPLLVGLRPDGAPVSIEGMSDGTRDQLYLALRLAALDQYLQTHEPMPLILDDLLITCDDDRAAAILPQLAALSRSTQVFLFTHHDHLVELCRKTLAEEAFQTSPVECCQNRWKWQLAP